MENNIETLIVRIKSKGKVIHKSDISEITAGITNSMTFDLKAIKEKTGKGPTEVELEVM